MHRLLSPLIALFLAVAALPAPAAPPAPVEGRDFVVIEGGRPYAAAPGTVEVAEIFGYTCPHCARFEPALAAWKRTLPRGARFVAIPAPFGGYWIPYARAYVAAKELGIADRTHEAMFRAVHDEGLLPISNATPEELASFYQRHGIPAARFVAAYKAPSVDAELQRAREFIERSGVEGTPAMVVAGKYRVTGRTADDQLRIARWLVERELAVKR